MVALMLNGCANGLFYYPDGHVYSTPDKLGLPYKETWFSSADGTRLQGWFIPATTPVPALGTVVHFHGNAQNMTSHYQFVAWLPAEGFNVFVFDYRGYGASGGKKPTRQGTFEDGVAALAHVAGRPDVDPRRLIIYGQSLGGALALAVAGETHPCGVRAVIAESAFSTYRGAAGDAVGAIPALGWLLRPLAWLLVSGGHNPAAAVAEISPVPLLLIHGTADHVVPYRHGERLVAQAREPKCLLTMPGAGHTAAADVPEIRRQIVEFMKKALLASPR
jgi:fermentation-respiration switch protein FrsA (DUF1100 family)